MKATLNREVVILVSATLFAVTPAFAHEPGQHHGQTHHDDVCDDGHHYAAATEYTVTGVVQSVQQQQSRNFGTGLHLTIKTDTGLLNVHVGPANWLAAKGYQFAPGDTLVVTGSEATIGGTGILIAREIVKNGQTFTLRHPGGMPLWAHGGARTH